MRPIRTGSVVAAALCALHCSNGAGYDAAADESSRGEPEPIAGGASAGGGQLGEPSSAPATGVGGAGTEGNPAVSGIVRGTGGSTQTSTPAPAPGIDPSAPVDCTGATLQAGDHTATLTHAGRERQYLVHVPASYVGATPVPLVLDLHGLTSSARQQASLSGWREKADQVGFIVAHPDGLDGSWNGGDLCCGSSLDAQVDDEGFMRALVQRLSSEACIDPKRVYATGLSNGGAMAHLLACRAADVFAATAPVSMGNGTEPCTPTRPISVIMTRGTQDRLVAYDGGFFPSAAQDFEAWRDRNACAGAPEPSEPLCETHTRCAGDVEVTSCSLDAGHVLYANSQNFSVPDVVWAAFARHTLP
jgi:polyhydroxybutyrate depolymerase